MAMKDMHNNINVVSAIPPVVVADDTPQVSAIIDTDGFESVEFVTSTGTLADAGATFTASVEDGDDAGLSDAAAVDDSFLIGTEAEASFDQDADDSVRRLGYIGKKRYVRYTITPAGNAANAPLGVVAILGNPHSAPVPNNA